MEKKKKLHPDPGKQGVNFDKKRYNLVGDAILNTLEDEEVITLSFNQICWRKTQREVCRFRWLVYNDD